MFSVVLVHVAVLIIVPLLSLAMERPVRWVLRWPARRRARKHGREAGRRMAAFLREPSILRRVMPPQPVIQEGNEGIV